MRTFAADRLGVATRLIRRGALSDGRPRKLVEFYHTTRNVWVRTRAEITLPAGGRGMVATEIPAIARWNEETVQRWSARYLAGGIAGLSDAPRGPGAPPKATVAHRERLLDTARHRPRRLRPSR